MPFSAFKNVFNVLKNYIQKYWFWILISIILFYGFIFRLESFIIRESWIDEVALACNLIENDGLLWVFLPLKNMQMAPPLFLAASKIVTEAFGGKEWSYRVVPFLCAVLSMALFYVLSTKFLLRKRSVIFANFLYAVNFALIRYSTEFKQYQTDILAFMMLLLYLSSQSLEKLDLKGFLKYNLIFLISFIISQPTIFLVFGFVLYHIILKIKADGFKDVKGVFRLCFVPVIPLAFVIIYKFYLTPKELSDFMNDWWADGFITFQNIFHITVENTNFFFYNIKCLYFLAPLIFAGFFIFLFKRSKISNIFILSLLGVFLAGVLQVYPYLHRLILFLFPFFIIFISKVFDLRFCLKRLDKAISIALGVFVFLFLNLYQNYVICKNRSEEFINISRARSITEILKDLHKEGDVVILPGPNQKFYTFYNNSIGLNFKNVIKTEDYTKDGLSGLLWDKNKFYWIYIPSYSKDARAANALEKWVKEENGIILYKIDFNKHFNLYKVKFM